MTTTSSQPRLGLRANLAQFCLLVAINALVGGMVGQEQTVLPLLAHQVFHLTGYTFLLTYVFAFGATKAATNYFAGTWSDRFGRKPVLLAGWLLAIPVPLLLIWAPSWAWVIVANVLLGINQGLTWSTTVIMKIDLVGPRQRGLAMGFNEAAGYLAVALTALSAGFLAARFGLRPAPFLLGLSYALIAVGLTAVFVRETRGHAELEASHHGDRHPDIGLTNRQIFLRTSFAEPALSSASQAGLVNNLNFGLSWGLFPILFATKGIPVEQHRNFGGRLSGSVGRRTIGHRRAVRPVGSQASDHCGDVHPSRWAGDDRDGRHLPVVARRGRAAGCRHRHGLSHPAGRSR